MKKSLFFAVMFLMFASLQTTHAQQVNWRPPQTVPEHFDRSIAPWAGFTSLDPMGRPFIRYNPDIINTQPWFMNVYIRAHEYGHVFSRGPFSNPEANADCWAAQQLGQSDPQVLDQIINYLVTVIGPRGGDVTHGNGFQVAALMRQCSGR
jgi:hypothetical protein